ncbi:hypothetical protein Fcan01_17349 [Folsomia candida]|uniref:Uncharacterized protein n=1 Tax=Folsomia candida TaxID=158441 RepID=A0A226DV38_FOLCA|nr:hypothetical protein Fcan01_17349 [Folsomia candida]
MNSLREFAENVALKQRTRILSDFVVILVSNSHRIRDLVQAERENIYSEQVFEEDLEEIEVGNAVAAQPRTPNYTDEGTVDEEIQKSLKKVADRVGKRMRYKYILSIITVAKDFRNNIMKSYRSRIKFVEKSH